jgi:hypothetical protein
VYWSSYDSASDRLRLRHACASACSRVLGCPGDRRSSRALFVYALRIGIVRPPSEVCRCASASSLPPPASFSLSTSLSPSRSRSKSRRKTQGARRTNNTAASSIGRQDLLHIAALVCELALLMADEGSLCGDRLVRRPSAFSRPAELVDAAGKSVVRGRCRAGVLVGRRCLLVTYSLLFSLFLFLLSGVRAAARNLADWRSPGVFHRACCVQVVSARMAVSRLQGPSAASLPLDATGREHGKTSNHRAAGDCGDNSEQVVMNV